VTHRISQTTKEEDYEEGVRKTITAWQKENSRALRKRYIAPRSEQTKRRKRGRVVQLDFTKSENKGFCGFMGWGGGRPGRSGPAPANDAAGLEQCAKGILSESKT